MSDIQVAEGATAILEPVADSTPEDLKKFAYLSLPKVSDPSLALYAVRLLHDEGFWPAFLEPEVQTPVVANLAHPYVMTIEEMRKAPESKAEVNRLENPAKRFLTHNGRQVLVKTRAFRCADPYYKDRMYFELPEAARAHTTKRPVVEIKLWCPVWRSAGQGVGPHGPYDGVITEKASEVRLASRLNLKAGRSKANARQGECPLCATHGDKFANQADARRRIAILLEKLSMPVPEALARRMAADTKGH